MLHEIIKLLSEAASEAKIAHGLHVKHTKDVGYGRHSWIIQDLDDSFSSRAEAEDAAKRHGFTKVVWDHSVSEAAE